MSTAEQPAGETKPVEDTPAAAGGERPRPGASPMERSAS